jgi:hypothetical protein
MISKILKVGLAAAMVLTLAGAVPASANSGDVIKQGACSARSDWKLKLSPENGRIEVQFEVDSNVRGQNWGVRIWKNGNRIFRGTRTTAGASGSFTVRVVTSNPPGSDHFVAAARNPATGETCRGSATF